MLLVALLLVLGKRSGAGRLFSGGRGISLLFALLLLWAALYALGLMTEGRSRAVRFELIRLFVIVPLGIAAMISTGIITTDTAKSWLITIIYVLASAAGLVTVTARSMKDAHDVKQ